MRKIKTSQVVCIWCHPDVKVPEKLEGLCQQHFAEFAEHLKEEGHDIDTTNRPTKPSKQIGNGNCLTCGILCKSQCYCYGCSEFICSNCSRKSPTVAGKHTKQKHIDGLPKS